MAEQPRCSLQDRLTCACAQAGHLYGLNLIETIYWTGNYSEVLTLIQILTARLVGSNAVR